MPTYTIVDKDKDPLDPGEINAGSTIQVSDGDVFIIAPSANANVTFKAAGGVPADFDVQINATNTHDLDLKFEKDLTPSISVADNVDAADIKIDAKKTDAINFTAGDNVQFGQYDGSEDGADTISIGNGFTTTKNWKTDGGDDTITVGDDATFDDIDTGDGDDTLTFGDRATVHNVKTGEGDDTVRFGDDLDAHDIKTEKGDDTIIIGAGATVHKLDGGSGTDTLNTQTPGLDEKNIETTNVVCFTRGTLIQAFSGPVAVENLKVGELVRTSDHGYQPLRWLGSTRLDAETLRREPRLRPICIPAGALGRNLPSRDLRVSPQHRILIRSPIVQRMFNCPEIFIAAKKLTVLPGIDVVNTDDGIEYFHILFDRHEVVFAENAASESMFLGAQTLAALGNEDLIEIEALFCDPVDAGTADQLARPCPKQGAKLRRLLERHMSNNKTLLSPRPDGVERRPAPFNTGRDCNHHHSPVGSVTNRSASR